MEKLSARPYISMVWTLYLDVKILISLDVNEVLTPADIELSLLGSSHNCQWVDQNIPPSWIPYLLGRWPQGIPGEL